ncbi:Ubiquitin-conjugating enzyme E2 34 [Asimina triloba]
MTINIVFMAERACVKRLQKEYRMLCKVPSHVLLYFINKKEAADVDYGAVDSHIVIAHYVLEGSEGTPFAVEGTTDERLPRESRCAVTLYSSRDLESYVMDNSPTTGSVSTSAAEKQSPTFKKMFPEYVEKHNQQLAAEQCIVEQSALHKDDERSTLANPRNNLKEEGRENMAYAGRNRRRSKKFPFWVLLLLVSVSIDSVDFICFLFPPDSNGYRFKVICASKPAKVIVC